MGKVIISLSDFVLREGTLRHLSLLDRDNAFEFQDGTELDAPSLEETLENYRGADAVVYQVIPVPSWPRERQSFGHNLRRSGFEGKIIAYGHTRDVVGNPRDVDHIVTFSGGDIVPQIYELLQQ